MRFSTFGRMPGVIVHTIPEMTLGQIGNIPNGPGTTFGGFCNSGARLATTKRHNLTRDILSSAKRLIAHPQTRTMLLISM